MKAKTFLLSMVFIFCVAILAGCQSSGENKDIDANFSDGGAVEINTALTPEDLAKNKLTVLNVWATWCPPCVKELPELQKVSENYIDKGVEVVGVLHDGIVELGVVNDSAIEAANTLMLDANANYRVILPDEYITTNFISSMRYFPTTFFLDSNGTAVKTVIGANDYESWGRLIDEALKELEN